MFYFLVDGAGLIFCQMSLTYTYRRPNLLHNPNSQVCQVVFLLLSRQSVGQCHWLPSIVLVMSSPRFS